MPEPRVLDLSPGPAEPHPIENFLGQIRQRYVDQQDKSQLDEILKEYQANRDQENAWEDMQLKLERSDISPTRRLQAQASLNEIKKQNIERNKSLNERFRLEREQAKEKAEEIKKQRSRESLEKSGASEAQINLYDAASRGGETEIMKKVLEDIDRTKTPEGLLPPNVEDKDKGLTPKERVERQEKRFTIQTPLLNDLSEKIKSYEEDSRSISLLQHLDDTGKVGQGISNLNINPLTGSLIIPKASTAEEQLFVKTVNDFTVRAKASYGGRVTNFELDRFMQRLPTLANSKEGRALIMRQMSIINQINELESKAIQRVFDQYGVRNIDFPDAEKIARSEIEDQKEVLKQEFFDLESLAKQQEMEFANKAKESTRQGYTAMRKPDGTIKQFPNQHVSSLEEKGYKKI